MSKHSPKSLVQFVTLFLSLWLLATVVNAKSLPPSFSNHKFNAKNNPTVAGGVITFHIRDRECSNIDYGDGRGETDCNNGNVRSVVTYNPNKRLGQIVEYSFDIKLDNSFAYKGEKNLAAEGYYPGAHDSALRLASWEGPFLHNFLYMLKADTVNGLSFLAKQCQTPEKFGEWVNFSMKIHWVNTDKGWIKVTCDGRLVYAAEAVATNQSPHCWESNQCEPWKEKDPKSFNFILGPVFQGHGGDWKKNGHTSVFREIQADGITVSYRNLKVRDGASLYGEEDSAMLKGLQQRLTELGCFNGRLDGKPSSETTASALGCKTFKVDTLPKGFDLMTLPVFVELYSSKGVENLPRGVLKRPIPVRRPKYSIKIAEKSAHSSGKAPDVNSSLFGTIKGVEKRRSELFFIVAGRFDFNAILFQDLSFIIQTPLGDNERSALKVCNPEINTFPDGSKHLEISFLRRANTYTASQKMDCYLQNLSGRQEAEARFIAENFGDIAINLVNSGKNKLVRHDGLRDFIVRVATGEVTIGR